MLSDDPPPLCSAGRSVCVVADEHSFLTDGGEPGGLPGIAASLRSAGLAVHVLWCGRPAQFPRQELVAVGARCPLLDEVSVPGRLLAANIYGPGPKDRSDRVRFALEALAAERPFDLVLFPTRGGLGFRAVQARRNGSAFPHTLLAVCLDSTSAWERCRDGRWPADPAEVEVDFMERYAFENAGVQLGWSRPALDHARSGLWTVRPGVDSPEVAGPGGGAGPGRLGAVCSRLVAGAQATARADESGDRVPPVTVCIAHYNLGEFLPDTLASLETQTYPDLEVLVIDDGSTDPHSRRVIEEMEQRHPRFRFLRQANAGIGATRNRGLREARGEYFLPVDADNVARPEMVERLVAGIRRRPDLGALTCYFLAFEETEDIVRRKFPSACRPAGGPHLLASLVNVYGDANAVYRTEAFRAVGGYETDRNTSYEDWEAFVKLVHAGYGVDVLPEYLFYYRHRPTGFSRSTDHHANRERVLRQFRRAERLPPAEQALLWDTLAGFHQRLDELAARENTVRYRVVNRLHAVVGRVPGLGRALKRLLRPLA